MHFENRDAEAVRNMAGKDDLIDNLYDQIFRDLFLL